MSDHQQHITATTGDKTSVEIATTTSASTVHSEEEGIEVIGVQSLDHNTNDNTANVPSMIDTRLLTNNTPSNKLKAQLQDTQVPIRRNSSPRSLMDFDVMATTNDDDNTNRTHMNHSHDAFEIQRKTLAMRELDLLLGHVIIDDETVVEKEASFVIEDNEQPLQTVNESTEQQHLSTLFSCTMDDIDEVVQDIVAPLEDIATPLEELISPFHRFTDLLSCRGGGGCMVELEEEGVGCRFEIGETIGK